MSCCDYNKCTGAHGCPARTTPSTTGAAERLYDAIKECLINAEQAERAILSQISKLTAITA